MIKGDMAAVAEAEPPLTTWPTLEAGVHRQWSLGPIHSAVWTLYSKEDSGSTSPSPSLTSMDHPFIILSFPPVTAEDG
jgi:hypothetical protein